MNRLTYSEFLERRDEFAAAVNGMDEIATFCSGPIWGTAAHDSLHEIEADQNHFIVEHEGNWLVFVERQQQGVYFPLESGWLFGSPLIGDTNRLPEFLLEAAGEFLPSPVGFVIGGVRNQGKLHQRLRDPKIPCLQLKEFPATDCMTIDLSDGVDGWLTRRSRKFRRTMRNLPGTETVAIENGEQMDPDAAWERMLAIQRLTYKWKGGDDIFLNESYAAFYRNLFDQVHERGVLRLLFATKDGKDVGYIFGGVPAMAYRGFQMSYVEEVRDLGIGNMLQFENLRRCAAEGITEYDLGMHAPYKERWADRQDRYSVVFLVM